MQQGESAALDLEKLVSTVAAQKLVLETPAGNAWGQPCPLPSHVTPPSCASTLSCVPGPSCLRGRAVFCWPRLPLPAWALSHQAQSFDPHPTPCRHESDREHRGCGRPLPAAQRGESRLCPGQEGRCPGLRGCRGEGVPAAGAGAGCHGVGERCLPAPVLSSAARRRREARRERRPTRRGGCPPPPAGPGPRLPPT